MIKSLLLLTVLSYTALAQEAKPLADGKTLAGWVKADGSAVAANDSGWEVVDGVIHRKGKSGDIYTAKEYANFEFEWDWKISSGGNSGVKYRVTTYPKSGLLGPEYQMIDDEKHSDGKLPTHKTGCIYDCFPTIPDKPMKAVGEWNHSKIVVQGSKFEHWLNGTKVSECDTSTPAWDAAVAQSKFKGQPNWAKNPAGKIMLQDHGDEVWFRNLQIKELPSN